MYINPTDMLNSTTIPSIENRTVLLWMAVDSYPMTENHQLKSSKIWKHSITHLSTTSFDSAWK